MYQWDLMHVSSILDHKESIESTMIKIELSAQLRFTVHNGFCRCCFFNGSCDSLYLLDSTRRNTILKHQKPNKNNKRVRFRWKYTRKWELLQLAITKLATTLHIPITLHLLSSPPSTNIPFPVHKAPATPEDTPLAPYSSSTEANNTPNPLEVSLTPPSRTPARRKLKPAAAQKREGQKAPSSRANVHIYKIYTPAGGRASLRGGRRRAAARGGISGALGGGSVDPPASRAAGSS